MKRTWFYALLAVVVIAAVLVSACAPAATPAAPTATSLPEATATTPPPEPTPTPPPPAVPKTVTLTFFEEPDTLNPLYSGMWYTFLSYQLYLRGAWSFDENNEPVPELCTEVPSKENGGLSEDGLTITYKLRDGVVWSDGEPVTSADFAFTYEMYVAEANVVDTRYPYADYIESVETPDDLTFIVHLKEPFAAWLTGFFAQDVIPKHILEPVFEAEGTLDNAAWNRAPTVGCGPFVLKEWEAGSHLLYEANPLYWRGRPNLDQVNILIVPEDEAQIAAIKTGDTDVGVFLSAADVPELEALGTIEIVMVSSGYNESLFFNLNTDETAAKNGHPALQDVRVRQAIAYAFPRQQVCDEIMLGLRWVPPTYWDGMPYANPDIEPYPYDLDKANELLDEAGWIDTDDDGIRDKDGVKLSLVYSTTAGREVREQTQVVAQESLTEVGIEATISNNSYDTMWNSYGEGGPIAMGKFDFAQWSDTPDYPDPDLAWLRCSEIPSDEYPDGVNWFGICDEELDALFQAQATEMDYDKRVAIFHDIGQMMHDEVYWLGVWNDSDIWSVNKRVKNVIFSGGSPMWNCYEWDVVE